MRFYGVRISRSSKNRNFRLWKASGVNELAINSDMNKTKHNIRIISAADGFIFREPMDQQYSFVSWLVFYYSWYVVLV